MFSFENQHMKYANRVSTGLVTSKCNTKRSQERELYYSYIN